MSKEVYCYKTRNLLIFSSLVERLEYHQKIPQIVGFSKIKEAFLESHMLDF